MPNEKTFNKTKRDCDKQLTNQETEAIFRPPWA